LITNEVTNSTIALCLNLIRFQFLHDGANAGRFTWNPTTRQPTAIADEQCPVSTRRALVFNATRM
jgi:hypothetical protein